MKELNCCSCCGQSFDLIDEDVSEDKSVSWPGLGDICPSCYQDMLEIDSESWY